MSLPSFHIQQVAKPMHIERILKLASGDQLFDAETMKVRLGQEGYQVTFDGARRSLDLGRKLGLFEKSSQSTYVLTALGQACHNLAVYRREVYCDVMHFLLFTTWELGGQQNYWSWTYAKAGEIFWRDKPKIRPNKIVFRELSAEASKEFPDLDPVIGTETITAMKNWLRELSPPFISLNEDKPVASQEREWFSVELALLAVSYLYAVRGAAIQTPILLDRLTVEQLCPLCLTSVDRIMTMVESAARTFPFFEIHTGEWGSSAILRQAVDIPMLT